MANLSTVDWYILKIPKIGVKFEDRDVTEDEEALRELTEKYKSRSTPTIVIRDEVIVGFDKRKLDKHIS